MKNDPLNKIAETLLGAKSVDILTHENMDGDAIGSSVALCLALKKEGIKARVITEDDTAEYLQFLEKGCIVHAQDAEGTADVCAMLDCGDASRFPEREKYFKSAAVTVCVDHHVTSEGAADLNYVVPGASAAGELVYDLLKEMGTDIDTDIAEEIFAAIVTDTGKFMYQNTTKKSYEVVCELFDTGFDHYEVSKQLYENDPKRKIKLHGDAVSRAESLCGGKLMYTSATKEMLERNGAYMEDTEGIVSILRSISGVEVALLFKEKEEKVTKVSLRSKEYIDVSKIAAMFDGGGHARAAGCTIREDIETARKKVIDAVTEELCRE